MLTEQKIKDMKRFSKKMQMEILKMIHNLGVGHVGGSLSAADVISVLYEGEQMKYDPQNPKWDERDWFVCSKGHAGPSLYAALALKGFFPVEELKTLNQPGTRLVSHCDRNKTPGVDVTTGSLGQGGSLAAGVALGHRMNNKDNNVFLLMGDGELDEGQVWEMALFAPHWKLTNLIAFVDNNGLQLDGPTCDVCNLGDIEAKFREFGWYTQTVDGHDVAAIYEAIEKAKDNKKTGDKPSMIVLNTIKGQGWSKTAGQVGSHSRGLTDDELAEALGEMRAVLDSLV